MRELRNVVCTVLLAGFIYGLSRVVHGTFDHFGFLPGMAFCAFGLALAFIYARSVDRRAGR